MRFDFPKNAKAEIIESSAEPEFVYLVIGKDSPAIAISRKDDLEFMEFAGALNRWAGRE